MVTFMADTRSELTQALDMVLDDEGVMGALGNPRCKRFALVRPLCAHVLCRISLRIEPCRHYQAHLFSGWSRLTFASQMIDDGTVTAVNLSEAPGDPAGDADPEGPITALTRVETMIKLA
jgi:hypothetical protein